MALASFCKWVGGGVVAISDVAAAAPKRRRTRWIKILAATTIALLAAPFALVYAAYWNALNDLPDPLPQAQRAYPDSLRQLYWTLHGGQGPIQVRRMSPPGYVWELFADDAGKLARRVPADHQLLYRVASTMQSKSLPRRRISRWHLTNAALTVYLSRHYDGRQLIDYALDQTGFSADGRPGIDAAARRYFDSPVDALSPHEQVALLALARGPSRYDPACHPERFAGRYAFSLEKTGLAPAQALPARMRVGVCQRGGAAN